MQTLFQDFNLTDGLNLGVSQYLNKSGEAREAINCDLTVPDSRIVTDNGVTVTLVSHGDGQSDMLKGAQPAYAVIGPVLAMGDVDSVKASIATNGAALCVDGGIVTNPF